MKTQKGIIHLGLILVLLIFGIGALVFVMYKTNSLPKVSISSPSPSGSLGSMTHDEQNTNWETYTNVYFSIKYPTNWELASQTDRYVELVKKDGPFNTVTQKNASIAITSTPENLNYAGCAVPYDIKLSLDLDGEPLTLGARKQNDQYGGSVTKDINQCWFSKNSINYAIHYSSSDDISSEIKQILSTFEFVDTPGDSEKWNTYTNTKYKYTFEYPKSWKVDDELTKDGATNTSESVLVYSPETNGTGTLFNGITIQNSGMLVDTTNRYRVTLPNVATTVYKQDTMHGEVYYINIPDTDQFLSLTGVGGYTDNEDIDQTVKKIFSTFKLPY